MPKQHIQLHFKLPVTLSREGSYVIASILPLDVHSQGNDEEEAVKNVIEAFRLFARSCIERGTLDQVLLDCGFHPGNDGLDEKECDRIIDVPIPMVAQRAQAHPCWLENTSKNL